MTKKKAQKASASNTPSSKGYTYKDLVILYGKGGFKALQKLVEDGDVSVDVLRRAGEHQADRYSDKKLAKSIDDAYPVREPGRAPPELGEKRRYRAQQYKVAGAPSLRHIRLPVHLITKKKGDVLEAEFLGDRVILTAVSNTNTSA